MAQIFDAPSKAILRSQIAEHIAENDNNDRRVDQEGEAPLPKDRFFDRELSWLKFNQRVLECAENEDMPLLERANFAAIFASNLDEFFMVRVAGLKRRIDSGIAVPSAAGLSPRQQLRAISETAHRLQDEHAHYTIDTILPELEKERIVLLTWDKLTSSEQERLSRYYRQQVFPVLTPLAVDPAHPFPYISGGSINLAVIVENPASGKSHFARVKIPGNLPRLVPVDDMTDEESKDERYGFIAMEKLIAAHLESLFPGMIIKEARSFGDLSENSEYDEAKNEQGKLYSRIAEVENILANYVVIEEHETDPNSVRLGSKVKVLDLEFEEEESYQVGGSQEADPMNGRISEDSPFGKALLGNAVGDEVQVEAPAGVLRYRILEIQK